jgi:hypothetical protein
MLDSNKDDININSEVFISWLTIEVGLNRMARTTRIRNNTVSVPTAMRTGILVRKRSATPGLSKGKTKRKNRKKQLIHHQSVKKRKVKPNLARPPT